MSSPEELTHELGHKDSRVNEAWYEIFSAYRLNHGRLWDRILEWPDDPSLNERTHQDRFQRAAELLLDVTAQGKLNPFHPEHDPSLLNEYPEVKVGRTQTYEAGFGGEVIQYYAEKVSRLVGVTVVTDLVHKKYFEGALKDLIVIDDFEDPQEVLIPAYELIYPNEALVYRFVSV